jgi:hypothetical protein
MAVSGNTILLSALEGTGKREMEGFHAYAAFSERKVEAVTERGQLDGTTLTTFKPITKQAILSSGLSLETTADMCWSTSISSFEVLGIGEGCRALPSLQSSIMPAFSAPHPCGAAGGCYETLWMNDGAVDCATAGVPITIRSATTLRVQDSMSQNRLKPA